MRPTMQDLVEIVRGAGEIAREGYHQDFHVDYKSEIDPVTEIDRKSEAYILDAIHQKFPDHRIISEETGGMDGNNDQTWIVDPIDGTVNFSHRIPIFCVSIAYAEGNHILMGVIYDPMRDECFSAIRDEGAWMNGDPIKVSDAVDVGKSLLVTGFPYDIRRNPDNNLEEYGYFALRSQGVRRLGSAALDLCYIAAGRFDGYWEKQISLWDIAAGYLIVEEAGGEMTNLQGKEIDLNQPLAVLATNGHIHSEMVSGLNQS